MTTEPVPVELGLPLKSGPPRTAGVHVSSVIRNLAIQKGHLKISAERIEDLSLVEVNQETWWSKLSPVDRLRMCMGLAWEEWYVPQLGHVVFHPGEMELDGIYMTHDGESLDTIWHPSGVSGYELALHEVKLTYKSTKTVDNLRSQWMWLTQCRAYCKGLGTRTAYIHVMFVCGDYGYPIQPQIRCWKVTFTQDEIDATWEEIISYVQHYIRQEREQQWLD